jgi:hypothetical protein
MISLFRINDPFRVIIAALILLGIRLPLMFSGDMSVSIPELTYQIVGEKLANGGLLYEDIWESVAPLSALFYWIIYLIAGKSVIFTQFIAIFLVIQQAFYFNQFLINYNVYDEKTYTPSLFYVIFMCISVDFFFLTPPLIALSFLLPVMKNVFKPEYKSLDQDIFVSGIYLGIANLIYLPTFWFLLLTLVGYIFFRTSSIKTLFVILYGYGVVIFTFLAYLYYYDLLGAFYSQNIGAYISGMSIKYMTVNEIGWLLLLPAIYFFLAVIQLLSKGVFTNVQSRCQQFLFMWGIVAAVILLTARRMSGYIAVLIAPVFAAYVTYWVLSLKKKILTEFIAWTICSSLILVCYNSYYDYFPEFKKVSYERLFVQKNSYSIVGKKILVLGNDISCYYNNYLATPYLNWHLTRTEFNKLDTYSGSISLFKRFEKDLPEIIIDKAEVAEKLFAELPILAAKYEKDKRGYYTKKSLH